MNPENELNLQKTKDIYNELLENVSKAVEQARAKIKQLEE